MFARSLRSIRARSEAHSPDTIDVYIETAVPGPAGGTTYALERTVMGRIAPLGARTQEIAAALDVDASYVVTLPAHTRVPPDRKLRVTMGSNGEIIHLNVTAELGPRTYEAMRGVLCTLWSGTIGGG